MTKDQIAVATVFHCVSPAELHGGRSDPLEKERVLVVVNTHIHWDPEYPDVKLMQVCMLLEELELILNSNKRYADAPLIICGDFNSLPDSGVYKFLRDGKLESNHPDFHGLDYGRYTSEGPRHPFRLASAYESVGEPPFTNFTGNFVGCLDYIFYSNDKLEVCKILKAVDEDVVVSQTGALPNAYMCSDHIPLVSEFVFTRIPHDSQILENGRERRGNLRHRPGGFPPGREVEYERGDERLLAEGQLLSRHPGGESTYPSWFSHQQSGHRQADYWSEEGRGGENLPF